MIAIDACCGSRPVAKAFGARVVDQVDLGHRHVRRDRHLADDVHQLRRGGLVDRLRPGRREDELVAGEVAADRDEEPDDDGDDRRADRAHRVARQRIADRESEQGEEEDDDEREDERVPLVRGLLRVERGGHGGASARRAGPLTGPRAQLRLRSTVGTFAASGSASKKSRFVKPNIPAKMTFGNVWMPLL